MEVAGDGYYRASSWAGSERSRGGVGKAPETFRPSANPQKRFTVPAGTRCAVRNVRSDEWQMYTTTRECGFDTFDRWVNDESGNYYEFRADGGWMMLVRSTLVLEWGRPYRGKSR